MRPRARGKKLLEEWALPLNSIEDVYEVLLLPSNQECKEILLYQYDAICRTLDMFDCFISEIYEVLPWKVEKQSMV